MQGAYPAGQFKILYLAWAMGTEDTLGWLCSHRVIGQKVSSELVMLLMSHRFNCMGLMTVVVCGI